ncbi:uncharacterized protein [Ptychodera flava]|uniref:uncharacterized protein n=1 Tax=Ptychodera flava TaxID=63121 RepID=UPI003969BF29
MATSLSFEDKPEVGLWEKFLIDMSKEMTDDELRSAKVAAKKAIGSKGFEEITDGTTFFNTLEKGGYINEDDTHYLEEIFESISLKNVMKEVEKYKKSRAEYVSRRRELANTQNVDFVGRERYLKELMDMLRKQSEKVTCISICGLAGMGKTELALEICARLNYRSYRVDLREKSSGREVILEILSSLGMSVSIDSADFSVLRGWTSSCKIDTILFIDNADQLVEPGSYSSDDFHNTLRELLQVKNERLRILITSRFALRENLFRSCHFKQIELTPFEVHESVKLLQKLAGADRVSDREANDLAIQTGNLPLALKIIASRLKDGIVKAQDFINQLDPAKKRAMKTLTYGTHGAKPIDQCLQFVFKALPENLKIAWLKLSVFPSTFDQTAAMGVLKTEDLSTAKLDILQPLVSLWKVINAEPNVSFENLKFSFVDKYSLHPLVRSYLQETGKDEDLRNSFDEAQKDFVRYYDELLRKNAKKVEKNYLKVMRFLIESNKTNLDHYLKLMNQLKISPRLENKKDHGTLYSTYLLFEHYLDPDRRINIFKNLANVARENGKTIQYCFLRGFEADSWIPKAYPHKALEILREPLRMLKNLENEAEANTDNYKLTLATCEYVQGRSLVKIREVKSGIALLEKSLDVRKKLLKNHTYVARSMNAIGHAYYNEKDIEKSLKFHKEAVDVLYSVSEDGTHLDMPTFILNVGTCCHSKGNQAAERHDSEESERYYNEALAYYDKAIDLEKSMNIYGLSKTAVCLKNKALTYSEMKQYDLAMPLAVEAMEIRLRLLGNNHPDTARSVYFIGSLYFSMAKDAKEKEDMEKVAEIKESHELYKKALNYFKQATEIEVALDPVRRSIDYPDLQNEIAKVLEALHMDKEKESYEMLFLKARDQSLYAGSSSGSGESDESSNGDADQDSSD